MRKWSKSLALLLAVTLTATQVPMTAFAEESTGGSGGGYVHGVRR